MPGARSSSSKTPAAAPLSRGGAGTRDGQSGVQALLVDDARFDAHAPRGYHPERPERLTAARQAVAKAGVAWTRVEARAATDDELVRVHDARFIESLEKLRGQTAHLDPDTYVAPSSIEAARLAAGGLVALVDRMIDGPISTGVALLRPPGHHARPQRAMGFCLLNNVAVAAAHARARGVERVLVLDWDVHHGNGTQEMFYADPSVLYVSTHQFPFYPGTGDADETGDGAGRGYTVNVPLTAGGGDGVYRGAFERVILPAVEAFAPNLVLVSAGFDAAARDPLAAMELSSDAFGWMASALAGVAAKSAAGRIALVLEGGYDLVALESGLASAIDGMLGAHRFEVPRDVDNDDVARAAAAAHEAWRGVT
jgi:acetoin utilization deacetylase AcuC-like enzyme